MDYSKNERKSYDQGFDKGLAEGHYQADSMMKKMNKEQQKLHKAEMPGNRAEKCMKGMQADKRNKQAGV